MSGSHVSGGGTGGQGILVITYEPAVDPFITQADYRLFENPDDIGGTPWSGCRTESGTTTIPNGSTNSDVTLSKSISDMAQAYLLTRASGTSSIAGGNDHMVAGEITNASTLTFTRGASPNAQTHISYSLVECFLNEFSVQRGVTTIASGANSNTASISSVDVDKSMVIVSSYDDENAANQQTGLATGELQDSSTVLLRRHSSPSVIDTIAWQVVTFSDLSGASVQTGETMLGSSVVSQTAGISSVDTGHSFLYCTYDADSNGLRQTAVGCDLTDATTLTFSRYGTGSYNNRIRWYVVTFPVSGVTVHRGSVTDDGGSSDNARYDIDITLPTAVDSVTKAYPFITNTTRGTGTAFPRNSWIYELTNTNTLQTSYWRGSIYGSGTHYWQVVEFASIEAEVGDPLANENTPATLRSASRPFRLRMLLGVSDATVGQNTSFKLQYAPLSGTCSASTYSDISASSTIAYRDFNELNDGSPLVANTNDPVDGTNITETQTYVASNNFRNSESILSPGEDGEWDFSLVDNGAPANSSYCFRAVYADGTPLNTYSHYPQITTSDGVFNVEIVDDVGQAVSDPDVALGTGVMKFACDQTSGTLGTPTQSMRVTNRSAGVLWTLSMAATSGSTGSWTDGTHSFDFNDPGDAQPGCSDGTDSDTYSGMLSVGFATATISAGAGCTTDGVSLGTSAAFHQDIADDITLARAGGSAANGCYWDIEGIDLSQTIPAEQPPGTYGLDMTITLTSS
ncbi:hypothetical protein CSA80_04005 [Candidatus Saccharibacteria bacterium]|nr:MAG: hypothetical protein CR973_00080 [Candidatus Saccharibacteria bacterium]PID98845.1 MAG: hypothetical protein CSA80_04005 [Candidatus Saccharibacteria bacterium]